MNTVPCPRNRHSIRLKGYDYSRSGAYFVTIVAQDRARMFGYISGGTMKLNRMGEIVHSVLSSLDDWYPRVQIDAFQVMPDHIHAIVCLSRRATTPADAPSPAARLPDATSSVRAGPRACPPRPPRR